MTSHILSLVFFVLFFCFRLVYRMFGLPSWWFFLLCFPLLLEGQSGERPQLTNSRVLPLQGMVASERYEYLLTTLEFDQDVYVNDAFLCPGQDRDCVKSDCVPCDWSGEEPTDCLNPNCCGPAQHPQFPSSNHINDWCDSSLPSYEKLEFGVETDEFTLAAGEYKYYRFFIGEEQYCRSIRFQISQSFGDFAFLVSNLVAFPNQTTLSKIENGQQFLASSMMKINPSTSIGQGVIDLCPNVNPLYERGTISIAVQGQHPQNAGSITLYLGEERYPIAPPENRISCEDVPASEYQGVNYGRPEQYGGHVCLEDGVTNDFFAAPSLFYDIVLPIQPGCQEISLSYNGYTSTKAFPFPDTSMLIYCGQSSQLSVGENTEAAFVRSLRAHLSSIYISACFEEVTYLHCNAFTLIGPGPGKWMFSSTAKPIRHKLSETSPGMLSTYHGLHTAGAVHPALNYEGMSSWGLDGYSWLTQPSTDPLVFFPPSERFSFNFTQSPLQAYVDAGLSETKSNIVNIVDLTTRSNTVVRPQETLLEGGFVYILGLTNSEGLPVELCNDNDFENGVCDRGARLVPRNCWTDFMSTRTFATLNIVESTECSEDKYQNELDLVQREVAGAKDTSSLDLIAQKAYLSDLYNSGLARSACVSTMEKILNIREDNVTRLEKNFCPYEPLSPEWIVDPCCSVRAEAGHCCSPTALIVEEELYTDADPVELNGFCRHSDCDDSFFRDIASSLNTLGNSLVGCASGLGDPEYELDVLIERQMANFVRPCLIHAGFGEDFLGVKCVVDHDCEFLGTTCDLSAKVCRLNSTQETRMRYFDCFLSTMPPKIEDHIRRNVLPLTDATFPKNSRYFKKALLEAASEMDCLSRNPLDLGFSERYVANSALSCKGAGLGYQSLAEIEANEEIINTICPEYECLGERSCRFELAKMCKGATTPGSQCLNTYHSYVPPSLSSCPLSQTSCNIEGTENCDGFECVVCLKDEDDCMTVEGVGSEEECRDVVGCEMSDGTIRFDLTEEECLAQGDCSSDCDGLSCRSVDGKKGVCVAKGEIGFEGECESLGGQMVGGTCLLVDVGSEDLCAQVQTSNFETTQWASCEGLDLDTCSNSSAFEDQYRYLRCFVDEFRDCQDEQECIASGTCSDIEITKKIIPDPAGWFSVAYGTCLSSGISGLFTDDEPTCWSPGGEVLSKYGCHFPQADFGFCYFMGSPSSPLAPLWTSWITPAKTQETCQQQIQGRYGCALPKYYEKTNYFWNETDCECLQGTPNYLFSWTPGTWTTGKPLSPKWKEKNVVHDYTWEKSISVVRMEEWVRSAEEAWFVYTLKSQLVCETNYVTSSLSTLVCDCIGEGDNNDEGSSCFPSNIETEVGVTGVCAHETSVLKGPSSFTTFSPESLSDVCTEASLSLIQRSWFLFPRSKGSVSFQFAEKGNKGTVVNNNGANVGDVVGDGSKISFKHAEHVNHFRTCLLISTEEYEERGNDYDVKDFAILSSDFSSMTPLGLGGSGGDGKGRVEVEEVDLFTYWCAEIRGEDLKRAEGNEITLFPIVRMDGYEDEEDNSLSHRTESLLYTLASLYLFDLVLILILVAVMIKNYSLQGKDLPFATWMGIIFGAVCIFRIVFCFVYVDGGFSDLSEYVIFEIPTFLLFSVVILVTTVFMRLSKKNTFDFKSGDKKLAIIALVALLFVWSLFIIVTIIYSEVILEQNEESVCPGRVQSSNDEIEDDTRILSIVYQTIVIFLTLIFALVFMFQSRKLFNMTKNNDAANKLVFRLGIVIVTSFLLRGILFIILLAIDLTSDIYLFTTLLFTEVLMIFLISMELNKRFYLKVVSSATGTSLQTSSRVGTESAKKSQFDSRGPDYDM